MTVAHVTHRLQGLLRPRASPAATTGKGNNSRERSIAPDAADSFALDEVGQALSAARHRLVPLVRGATLHNACTATDGTEPTVCRWIDQVRRRGHAAAHRPQGLDHQRLMRALV